MMKTLLATLLFPAIGLSTPMPKDDRSTAEKLIGVWKLTGSSDKLPEGTEVTVEFTQDGALILKVSVGKTVNSISRGKFKAEGEKIHYAIDSGSGERKETLTVKSISADTLVVVDPDSKREEFRRVVIIKK